MDLYLSKFVLPQISDLANPIVNPSPTTGLPCTTPSLKRNWIVTPEGTGHGLGATLHVPSACAYPVGVSWKVTEILACENISTDKPAKAVSTVKRTLHFDSKNEVSQVLNPSTIYSFKVFNQFQCNEVSGKVICF